MPELLDDEEYELDMIKGESGKKNKLAILNKKSLSKRELDALMCGFDTSEEIIDL